MGAGWWMAWAALPLCVANLRQKAGICGTASTHTGSSAKLLACLPASWPAALNCCLPYPACLTMPLPSCLCPILLPCRASSAWPTTLQIQSWTTQQPKSALMRQSRPRWRGAGLRRTSRVHPPPPVSAAASANSWCQVLATSLLGSVLLVLCIALLLPVGNPSPIAQPSRLASYPVVIPVCCPACLACLPASNSLVPAPLLLLPPQAPRGPPPPTATATTPRPLGRACRPSRQLP